jgi:hypothetical protein
MSIVASDFPIHHKTRELDLLLGHNAGMYVIRLWCFCHCRMDDIVPSKPTTLAAICAYDSSKGPPKKLLNALLQTGYVEKTNDPQKLKVHEWVEHNARLFASQENGRKGGRPKNPIRTRRLLLDNPPETQEEPIRNPLGTHEEPAQNRVEKSRVDERRVEEECSAGSVRKFYERFRACHTQCAGVSEMAFVCCLREWPGADVVEAISAFETAWDGTAFTGATTPIKELRKYLRFSAEKKEGGGGEERPMLSEGGVG